VLVVGLGPAGYTLAHHLTREGFGVTASTASSSSRCPSSSSALAARAAFARCATFAALYVELDERILLGFGGVSEYGITVRWDKNFLTVLYVTLARTKRLRMYGGVRFGGTLTLDDAWQLGFDHVALAAGAGRPTIIDMKNNLARGIRKASDFLMALQLTGAYKASTLANLQVRCRPSSSAAASPRSTRRPSSSPTTWSRSRRPARYDTLARRARRGGGPGHVRRRRARHPLEHLAHAASSRAERARAATEGRDADSPGLVERWGGVSLVYRKRLLDSPAYRLNHEEVQKSLEEGVRYVENLSPTEALLDELRPRARRALQAAPEPCGGHGEAPHADHRRGRGARAAAARKFEPGQFYRLQNFETLAPVVDGTRLRWRASR
jgi:hypothetical protein